MKKKLIICIIVAFLIVVLSLICFYFSSLKAVDMQDDTTIKFVVEQNSSKRQIIKDLYNANLIHNIYSAYVYCLFNEDIVFKAGTFSLNRTMSLEEIFDELDSGKTLEQKGVNITLKEGETYSEYIQLIASSLSLEESDFTSLLSDNDYIQQLIDKYWFLTSDILNDNIYYVLEGYLFPDTYNFTEDSTASEVINKILDNMENQLEDYKEDIQNSNLSIHEIITLASIVELEASSSSDRSIVAGLFLNRINVGMSLGSDVTTYYAAGKDFSDELTYDEINACNNYNTRCSTYYGLPIGPISNPSIDAISAAVNPTENDYLYFVSDINKKIYFSSTYAQHQEIVASLKEQGMWYEYE